MTIDERLEFLLKSTESLHATAQEHTAQMAAQDARFERLRIAMVKGLNAFFQELEDQEFGEGGQEGIK
jgi:hypothetical protein